MMPRRERRGPSLALFLLLSQMANFGFSRIPPVTLVTILGQVALHLGFLDKYWNPSLGSVCVSALNVWFRDEWKRLLYATFFHADDWHLYYNMISMLWKGSKLERQYGSPYFACLLAVFSILVNVVMIGLSLLAEFLLHDSSYITQCAVGFSGVLFALKVVKNYSDPPGTELVMGFLPVPTKIVCWAELVIIHLLVPNSSFIGHLAGILVGLCYAMGPLRWLLYEAFSILPGINAGPSYTYHSGATGWGSTGGRTVGGGGGRVGGGGRRDSNGFEYTGGLSEEEQMRRAREESIQDYYNSEVRRGMPQPEHYQPSPSNHPARPTPASYQPERAAPPSNQPIRPTPASNQPSRDVDLETLRSRRLNRFTSPFQFY